MRRVRQHVKAKEHEFFAIVQPGFEGTALKELTDAHIGKDYSAIEGGISFIDNITACYRCCLTTRSISRLLMRVKNFRAENFRLFRKKMAAIPWELFIAGGGVTFSIKSIKSRLYHTARLEQEAFEAVAERMASYGLSVSANTSLSSQSIFIRLDHDMCTVSLNASGEPLYKRGEKKFIAGAPLRETLAATILLEAKIKNYDVLIDPMCGSGTFSIEAAGIAACRPAGVKRSFNFESWPVFSEAAYNHLKKEVLAEAANNAKDLLILPLDIDRQAVLTAEKNFEAAGDGLRISAPEKKDFLKDEIPLPSGKRCLIVLNPPYGERLSTGENIRALYGKIGKRLREKYSACGCAIIVPGQDAERALGLRYDRKIAFMCNS